MIVRRPSVRAASRTASAAVELAVVLPVLMFLLAITIDYSRLFYFSLTMENVVRNGAYFASNYPGLYGYESVADAAMADAPNMTPAPALTIRYGASASGPFDLAAPPIDQYGLQTGYVRVTADWDFHSVTNFPGLPKTVRLTRACTMRMAPIIPHAAP
jgi:Flp pilus assembly protein TadG